MRVAVHRELCVGAGNCVWKLPQVFAQHEEDGTVQLLSGAPDPSLREAISELVLDCPSQAIALED